MIISLRGTNGSGKSTLVRRLMMCYDEKKEVFSYGRLKPSGYVLTKGTRKLYIPGHYEIANGGVDTLKDLDEAYDLIAAYDGIGYDVIYEGKNMSDGVKRVRMNFKPEQVTLIAISTPVQECVASVRARGHRIKEETIMKLADKVAKNMIVFEALGFQTYELTRDEALAKCRELLLEKEQDNDSSGDAE